jgi:hypothetical protein
MPCLRRDVVSRVSPNRSSLCSPTTRDLRSQSASGTRAGSRSDTTRFLMKLIALDARGREPLRQFRTV